MRALPVRGLQYGSLNGYTTGLALAADTYYKMHIKVVPNSDGSASITATVRTLGDTVLGTYTTTVNTTLGDYCGAYSTFDQLGGASLAYIRSVQVQASGSTGYTRPTWRPATSTPSSTTSAKRARRRRPARPSCGRMAFRSL